MSNLRIAEIKAFVPSKNFELSKQFYQDLGFTMDSDDPAHKSHLRVGFQRVYRAFDLMWSSGVVLHDSCM